MQAESRRTHRGRQLTLALLSGALALTAWGQNPVEPAAIGHAHPTGHLHDHADQTWPPQPRGLRNVVPLSNPGSAERATELRRRARAERERIALARPEVRQALGKRYNRPDVVESVAKDGTGAETSRLMYFSYANNTTVEVTLDKDQVRGVRRIRAADYQPDITDEETAAAEIIARAYFEARSTQRVSALKAYGILAYLPEGTGFYPTRVIYLSFHAADDAPPEFAAWVDLTSQRVLRIREERS